MDFKKDVNRWNYLERKYDETYLKEQYGLTGTDVINAGLADIDFGVPTVIKNAIKKRTDKDTFSYSYVSTETLKAIAKWYKTTKAIDIDFHDVKLVHGTVNAMHQIVQALTKIGDKVLLQTPIYGPFGRAIINNKRIIVENKLVYNRQMHRYEIDFRDFEEKIKNQEIKLFMLCSPHNPGEVVWTEAELEKMVGICQKYNVIIFSDEVHSDLVFEPFSSIFKYATNNVILASSPNKVFNLGGLKASFLIIKDKELKIKINQQYEANSLTSPNVLINTAFITAYTNVEIPEWLNTLKEIINENYHKLTQSLDQSKFEIHRLGALYLLWINYEKLQNRDQFLQLAHNEKIIFSFGKDFYGETKYWFRLNLAMSEERLAKVILFLKTLK